MGRLLKLLLAGEEFAQFSRMLRITLEERRLLRRPTRFNRLEVLDQDLVERVFVPRGARLQFVIHRNAPGSL